MRHALLAFLALFVATAAYAQAPPKNDARALAGYWTRMPKDARLAYMVGATSGMLAFRDNYPDGQGSAAPRIDRALDAMDRLVADEAMRVLPMMAVAAAALAIAQNQDPAPALRIGRDMVGELTRDDLSNASARPDPQAPPQEPKRRPARPHKEGM